MDRCLELGTQKTGATDSLACRSEVARVALNGSSMVLARSRRCWVDLGALGGLNVNQCLARRLVGQGRFGWKGFQTARRYCSKDFR